MSTLSLRSNIVAVTAADNSDTPQHHRRKSFAKCSSKSRNTSVPSGDAADFVISENLRAQIHGLQQAKRKSADNINIHQAEQARETTDLVRRQIGLKAGSSVMANANAVPQLVLRLVT